MSVSGPSSGHGAVGAVSRLLDIAVNAAGPADVERALVREVYNALALREAVLVSVDERTGAAAVSARCPEPPPGDGRRRRVSLVGIPLLMQAREERAAMVLEGDDARSLGALLAPREGELRVLLVPLAARAAGDDVLIGAIEPGRELAPADRELVSALGGVGAATLAQLRLAAQREAQAAVQTALTRAAKILNESLDLGLVMTRICQEAATLVGSDFAAFLRGDADEGLVCETAHGLGPEIIGFHVPADSGTLAMRVARREVPMYTNDPRATLANLAGAPLPRLGSAMAVPVVWEGELRGVLAVAWELPGHATPERLRHLSSLADLAAVAARNASAHEGLAEAARTDGLTGCLNHAAMHEALNREITRSERSRCELSLILVDLDDFKKINEEHGHLAGDDILRKVGSALRQAVRPYDVVARYGGDEFAILAAESGEEGAAEVARRAIARVREAIEGHGGASAGVAVWSDGLSATDLIAAADRALLYGKQVAGRGGVILASGLP